MADIAILVAEEYERRIKNSRRSGGEEIDMKSCVAVLAQNMKQKFGEQKMELVKWKWTLEPKTQIGLAASYCFFSA